MMTPKQRQLLLIFLFILSIIAIGAAIYFLFFKGFTPLSPDDPTESPSYADLPSAEEGAPSTYVPTPVSELEEADKIARGGITQTTELTSSDVSGVTVNTSGDGVNFYNPSDGRFYTIDENGELVLLSDKQFPSADTIEWNADADKVVVEFPDGSNVVYDFVTETQVTLPSHWEDFDFSETGDEIAAKSMALDPNNRWLVVSNANGTNVQAVQELGENGDKVDVSWSPNDQVIGFADTATTSTGSIDRKTILPIGMNNENLKGLTVEGLGFDSIWSPDGKQLLYSVAGSYSDYKPLLWIVDATSTTMGENRSSLGINTWVEKCTFYSTSTVYCAVPSGLPANAGLQPDSYKYYADYVYKINLSSGKTSLVAIPNATTPMENLTVSDDESTLYYTNTFTGNLEMMRLN
jgi:hypothetical protein